MNMHVDFCKRLALTLVHALICFWLTASAVFAAEEVEPLKSVKLERLISQQQLLERQFFGQVVAPKTVELAFQVGGEIMELSVIEGGQVKQGEVIAQLDLEPFQLQVQRMELELQRAQRNLKRLTSLGSERVAQSDIDDLQTSVDLATVTLKQARRDLSQGTLRAPFDGVVANRLEEKFSTIKSGTPIVRLHDLSELLVEIDVPEIVFRRFDVNSEVDVYALLPDGPKRYPLTVREHKAETGNVGQTYSITLAMQQPNTRNLLPGASVTVIAKPIQVDEKIYISRHAVVFDPEGKSFLYEYTPTDSETGTLHRVDVDLAAEDDGRFSLVSGIETGKEVVVAGVSQLVDGQKVRRFTGFRD